MCIRDRGGGDHYSYYESFYSDSGHDYEGDEGDSFHEGGKEEEECAEEYVSSDYGDHYDGHDQSEDYGESESSHYESDYDGESSEGEDWVYHDSRESDYEGSHDEFSDDTHYYYSEGSEEYSEDLYSHDSGDSYDEYSDHSYEYSD